jgi:putative glutamine amidotransferase
MVAPVIGLTTYNDKNKYGYPISALSHRYITALTGAGGVPLLIPSGLTDEALKAVLERLDGILLTGGGDISIERFRGEFHPRLDGIDPERDATEFALLQGAVDSGKPFLGICRGFQMVNVALGGNLYTDIQDQLPGAIKHDYDSGSQRQFLAHDVVVEESSYLAGILGETNLKVNSLHHQGVKDLASALRPVAYAPDGLVEATELPGHPFGIAVQWHPEWLTDQPAAKRLFQAFVAAIGKG